MDAPSTATPATPGRSTSSAGSSGRRCRRNNAPGSSACCTATTERRSAPSRNAAADVYGSKERLRTDLLRRTDSGPSDHLVAGGARREPLSFGHGDRPAAKTVAAVVARFVAARTSPAALRRILSHRRADSLRRLGLPVLVLPIGAGF